MDSINVANSIVQLAFHLCLTSGAKGAIICSLMKRKLGPYLSTPYEVDRYNERVVMVNDFFDGSCSLRRRSDISGRQKGLLGPIGHLLCRDGSHLKAGGQYWPYKSIRGAVIQA